MDVIANQSSTVLRQASGNTGSCDPDILGVDSVVEPRTIQA
jgi:hypothetical protein